MAEKKTKTTTTKKAPEAVETTPVVEQPQAGTAPGFDLEALQKQLQAQQDLINQLTASVLAGRQPAQTIVQDEPTYPVENVAEISIGFTVFDEKLRMDRDYLLKKQGDKVWLTAVQIEQLKRAAPGMFERGQLACPDFVAENANVIRDYESFLAGLTIETLHSRIQELTSLAVLYSLFNHIETKRFRDTDDEGKPLTDKEGKPRLQQVPLPPVLMLAQAAVQQRVAELGSDLVLSTTDAE